MKLIHLSDLHIGKRAHEYSMLPDQRHILSQITDIIKAEKPDCVVIAGDVYDKTVPSAEALQLFDDFLVSLSKETENVFVISGNHDSPERISFGGRLMTSSGIHMSPVYNGSVTPTVLKDEYGKINIWMLPFVKPQSVRPFFENEDIATYTDAVRVAVEQMQINPNERNILITHQFVTGADRTESEEISVGGTDNVDVSVFDSFDYTALGHIHRAQNCKSNKVRYCGTPLKYSFSEARDKKSVTLVSIEEKGTLNVKEILLKPMHDMAEIKGTYEEIMSADFYKGTSYTDDYIHIILTDEEDIPDAIGKLRSVYKNLMKLDYDNTRTRNNNLIDASDYTEKKTPLEHFLDFYEIQNNRPMSDVQREFAQNIISDIWEGEV